MKYYLIAGEASGDLHASQLIAALRERDPQAQFQFLGGDKMAAAAGVQPVIHYRDMAYMGFIEVAKHLPAILGFLRTAREGIASWRPDAVILVDYPSFNLKVARAAHEMGIKVFYFISPKVWAWKQWRVRDIRKWVDRMFSILPFEPAWYRQHDYEVTYVGNPTVAEVDATLAAAPNRADFIAAHGLDERPIIALVPGSRIKEINDNLPVMLEATRLVGDDYQVAIAGAPAIDDSVYSGVLSRCGLTAPILRDVTMELVHHSRAAVVTSGTATLETALAGAPQVACYRMNGSKWVYRFYRRLLHGNYVTLPNLIVDAPLIPELLLHNCTPDAIAQHLRTLLPDGPQRTAMLDGYTHMRTLLTTQPCALTTAKLIIGELRDES